MQKSELVQGRVREAQGKYASEIKTRVEQIASGALEHTIESWDEVGKGRGKGERRRLAPLRQRVTLTLLSAADFPA